MTPIHAEASAVIDAPPDAVYGVLRDYSGAHGAILPKPYFEEMVILEGGQGAGTKARVRMRVMGTETIYTLVASEPQPGRVLVETDAVAGLTTTFRLEPLAGGQQTRLTIATDVRPSAGMKGWVERLINPLITRRIYAAELRRIQEYLVAGA